MSITDVTPESRLSGYLRCTRGLDSEQSYLHLGRMGWALGFDGGRGRGNSLISRHITLGQGQLLSSPSEGAGIAHGLVRSLPPVIPKAPFRATGGDIPSALESTPQGITLNMVAYGRCN